MVPLRFFLLYVASLAIVVTRKNYLHVQYRGYSNLLEVALGQFVCMRAIVYELVHLLCSFLISLAYSDLFRLGAAASSYSFNRCLLLSVWVLIPTLYTLQHCFFDLDRLSFSFETHFQAPQQYINSKISKMIIKCAIMAVSLGLVSPFIFALFYSFWWVGIVGHIQLLLLSFCIFINLEFINIAFNAHMSIGCLHKGKPISSLSSTPVETLVTGLNSKKPFTKFTAFQELSYRATSSDASLRLPIYHTRYRNTHIWPVILSACLSTMQETNQNVTNYLKSLENSMKIPESSIYEKSPYDNIDDKLFGNKVAVNSTGFSQPRFPGSPPLPQDGPSHRITLKDDDVLLKRNAAKGGRKVSSYNSVNFISPPHAFDEPIITQETALLKVTSALLRTIKRQINLFFFPSAISSQDHLPQVSIIEAWCISKKRQAEKLVPQPVCHAECIVALMGLLINAIEEDPKGGVVSSVGEVLKCLERSVGALGRFADWHPELNRNKIENKTLDVISILYDLSVSAFLEIVLKYNVLLNDLYLDEDVVKLSKWVLDQCSE